MKIYHVINPYQTEPGSEDEAVQQRTLDSIQVARSYVNEFVKIEIVAKVDEEEMDFFSSAECATLLKQNNITLVTWRELRDKIIRAN